MNPHGMFTAGWRQIAAEAALDGIYVIRTPVPAADLDAPGVVAAYKNLARVKRDFRLTNDLLEDVGTPPAPQP